MSLLHEDPPLELTPRSEPEVNARRIVTRRPRVPWTWVSCMMLPWMSLHYTELLSGSPLTFTLRKFVDQPALIAFLSSFNIGFNFLVGAVACYLSDRLWTRWGRRRPFLLVGWTGTTLTLIGIPLAPNLWSLAALIILYQFFQDVAKPYEPLYNEVVPPPQRGRGGVLRNVSTSVTGLVFNGVMLAQFDRNYGAWGDGGGFELRGEHLIYWAAAALTAAAVLFVALGVREIPPAGGRPRERFHPRQFVRDVFGERRWWMIYALYACPLVTTSVGNLFVPLVLTEQVGLTKAQFGWLESVTLVVNLLLFVPVAGFLADRYPRLRLMQIGMGGTAVVNLGLFVLLRVAPPEVVTMKVALAFSLFAGMSGGFIALKYIIWGPLVYDFIPSDRFGTVSAGFSFVASLAAFVLINLGGLWVQAFSAWTRPDAASGYDYSSIFLLQFVLGLGAIWFCGRFQREVDRGRIRRHSASDPAPAR